MENIECPYLSLLNSFWLFRAEGEIYFFSVCISVHPCPQLSIPFPRVGDLISSQSCQSCLNSFFYKPESIPYLLLLHVLHERPGFQEQLFYITEITGANQVKTQGRHEVDKKLVFGIYVLTIIHYILRR